MRLRKGWTPREEKRKRGNRKKRENKGKREEEGEREREQRTNDKHGEIRRVNRERGEGRRRYGDTVERRDGDGAEETGTERGTGRREEVEEG